MYSSPNSPKFSPARILRYTVVTRMIKKFKVQKVGVEFNSATKSKETRNKILDERTFWHEIIYKSLIPTFGRPTEVNQK